MTLIENSDYYIIQTSVTDEWFLYESKPYKSIDSATNYGNIRYTYDKESTGSSIWIDNVVVEEYDENMKFIQNVYEFSFNKSDYEWNIYGTQSYEIDSEGYDDIGGSLKLTSIGETGILTLRIDNTGFNATAGNYYKIKAYIKSTSVLDKRNARMSLIFANVGFAGGLKELSDYNFSKYQSFSSETSIPMICNEFGTNYNSIKNSDGDKYLYEVFTAIYKYKINVSLFSYSGFDFGLMYDNTRNFGTEKSKIRQDSYDALYKAIHQDNNTYAHIFKNIEVMQEYENLNTGERILVLGETLAGVGPKLEYIIVDYSTNNTIQLSNGLYALAQ